ncbi:LysR family transcriptional regulator [Pseudomonas aeruginosa]|uniref:LysR family transcriptional regulator n=1 Tax=Pseudomonas aeruginosa TaxID=287 RepID=UPI001F2791B3|nr:LysR family transcriptional regulator [Pseudomonas aeruginosa]
MKDLNLLYVFEAMWRDRSVTLAAESLGLTQAAVSSALKRLRNEHGDKLFTQVGRRMEPTPYAVNAAQPLLTALAMIRTTANAHVPFCPETARRQFTIRTRDIGEVVYFPRILQKIALLAPGVRLRTTFLPIDETVTGLASGRIDLALGFLPSLETAIHRRVLFEQHYVCVMSACHPLANEELTTTCFVLKTIYWLNTLAGHLVIERALVEAGARNNIKLRLPQYLSAPHFIVSSDLVWCARLRYWRRHYQIITIWSSSQSRYRCRHSKSRFIGMIVSIETLLISG